MLTDLLIHGNRLGSLLLIILSFEETLATRLGTLNKNMFLQKVQIIPVNQGLNRAGDRGVTDVSLKKINCSLYLKNQSKKSRKPPMQKSMALEFVVAKSIDAVKSS